MYSSGSAMDTSLPPLPKLKLEEIVGAAKDLEPVFLANIGAKVTDAMASHWAFEVNLATNYPLKNLTATFQQYKDVEVTAKLATTLAWQVASRGRDLQVGLLLAYSRPSRPEWVACEIQRVEDAVWRDDEAGVNFHLFALAGHPAGHVLQRKFPTTWLRFFAYQIGFSRATPFDYDQRHFIGLRFWGFMKPKPESSDVDFTAWELSPAFSKHNKAIIKLRTRFEHGKIECPMALGHLCWECPHRRSECPASPHPT